MAEPRKKVLKKIRIYNDKIEKDRAWKAAMDEWNEKSDAFSAALDAVTDAKKKLKDITGRKLSAHGISEGVDWDLKDDPEGEGFIVEIVERQQGRRPRIPIEDF
jgi:hypothetical protein